MFEEIDPNTTMRTFIEEAMEFGCGVKKPENSPLKMQGRTNTLNIYHKTRLITSAAHPRIKLGQ